MTTQIEEPESKSQTQGSIPVMSREPRVVYRVRTPQRRRPAEWAGWAISLGAAAIMILILVIGIVNSQIRSAATTATSTTSATNNTSAQAVPTVVVPPHATYNAAPPAAPAGPVAAITLTVKEVLVSIAPGIAYHAWTFNGTVPGPILRVREGQTVHFTLINDGTMPHSIDFHAAQTPWSVNYQDVAPGKRFSFDWKANYPGVFMYHCGAPTVIYHMANGMYGAIIVDPATGYTPAAKEYVLVQSEFYTAQLNDGSYAVDPTKLDNADPDYVVFNGYANQYKDAPLTAKAGEPIRLFIVNAGPSLFSAFHVIGAIFSDAYADGNPANHTVGDQTVMVPPGGAVMVQLTIPQPGLYPFVTHSFVDVGKGALGMIKITP